MALSIVEILQQIIKDIRILKYDKPPSISNSKASESGKDVPGSESKEKDSKEKEKVNSCSSKETEKESIESNLNISPKKEVEDWSSWSLEDREKIICIFSKVFLLNFPLYVAFKHSLQSKIDVSMLHICY